MTQYISKSAVIAEIDRIQNTTMDKNKNFTSSYDDGKFDALTLLENYIDTLEVKEEPISKNLEEAAWLYYDKNRLPIPPKWDLHKEFIDFFKAGAQWQKSKNESSTEDLEEVSKKYSSCIYLEEVLSDDDKEVLKARLMSTFKAGANWQKEQMIDKACEWLKEQNEMVGVSFEDDFIERFKNYMKK